MNRLYQIYDKKAETVVGNILSCKAEAVAIRTFGDTMKAEGTMIHDHPEDYQLIFLGTQDDFGAIFTDGSTGFAATQVVMEGLVMHQLINAPKDA